MRRIYHAIFVTTKLTCILVHFFHEYYEKDAISTSELNQQGPTFVYGLGSAAFVAYLSALCNKNYTGTQYALLSSIMGLARTVLSSPSGYLVESFGWTNFFILSTFLGIPALLVLFWMKKNFHLEMQKSKKLYPYTRRV